jgi:exopolysaccharide production protein ExoY
MLYKAAKGILDFTAAIVIGIIFFPFCILIALAIKLTSAGPVFADTPKRVGKNGKHFRMYKFRSMMLNAHQKLRTDPALKKLYEEYKRGSYKLRDDPRITPVGKFIRRFSLDELPQIINVLRGEMSIVGPRAYYPDELSEQQKIYPGSKKHVKEILKVKPGITGFWQVSGRSEVNFDKRVEMDADYAKRRSILYDLLIILKTPWAMVSGKGAL